MIGCNVCHQNPCHCMGGSPPPIKLNAREKKVLLVGVDLLMKGNPATRIAKYALEQGLTKRQLETLCSKLRVTGYVSLAEQVNIAYVYLERGMDDTAQAEGKRLAQTLETNK